MYVNDLHDCVSFVDVVMYADNFRLSIFGNCTATCNQSVSDIVRVFNWSDIWQLKMNIFKCGVMHIGHNNPLREYSIDKQVLSVFNDVKYLGITVDNNRLCFNSYIDIIIARAYRACCNILNGFYTNDHNLSIQLYKTFVRPILEYNTVTWSPS